MNRTAVVERSQTTDALPLDQTPLPGTELTLHHIGVAVPNIEAAAAWYMDVFGYRAESDVIHDPTQTAYVRFLRLPGETTYLELVSPDRPESKLANALKKGGGLNHVCYAVRNLGAAVRLLRGRGLFLLQAPVPAVAFQGRSIAWLMGRDRIPVELVERGPLGELEFAAEGRV